MTTMERIAAGLPAGARVAHDGTLWTKTDYHWWHDPDGFTDNNRGIDCRLNGGAEIIIDVVDLETEEIKGWDLEVGDYVVVTRLFWNGGGVDLFEENVDQQLWRVAGWSDNNGVISWVVLDAPEKQLLATYQASNPEDWPEVEPVTVGLAEGDVVRLVVPGQDHETWSWEWPNVWSQR
jgi:hypothetical protein